MKFKSTIVFSMVLSIASLASATGGFYCIAGDYERDGFVFELNGVTTRGFMTPVIQADGKLLGTLGDDGQQTEFNESFSLKDIKQYWSDDSEFRVILYRDMVFDQSGKLQKKPVAIIIKTTSVDGIEFNGQVSIGDGQEQTSSLPISCSVE